MNMSTGMWRSFLGVRKKEGCGSSREGRAAKADLRKEHFGPRRPPRKRRHLTGQVLAYALGRSRANPSAAVVARFAVILRLTIRPFLARTAVCRSNTKRARSPCVVN